MKKTGVALLALVLAALALEVLALSDPNDDLWTITAFFRALPCWSSILVWFGIGVLTGHFFWRD